MIINYFKKNIYIIFVLLVILFLIDQNKCNKTIEKNTDTNLIDYETISSIENIQTFFSNNINNNILELPETFTIDQNINCYNIRGTVDTSEVISGKLLCNNSQIENNIHFGDNTSINEIKYDNLNNQLELLLKYKDDTINNYISFRTKDTSLNEPVIKFKINNIYNTIRKDSARFNTATIGTSRKTSSYDGDAEFTFHTNFGNNTKYALRQQQSGEININASNRLDIYSGKSNILTENKEFAALVAEASPEECFDFDNGDAQDCDRTRTDIYAKFKLV